MTSGGAFWKKDNQDSNQPTRNFFKSPWICINRSNKYMCVLFKLIYVHAAVAKSLQSCLTLCDPIDGSPPGSPVPGILQARTLEWVDISFSIA